MPTIKGGVTFKNNGQVPDELVESGGVRMPFMAKNLRTSKPLPKGLVIEEAP